MGLLLTSPSELIPTIIDTHQRLFNTDKRPDYNDVALILGTIACESGWEEGFVRKQYGGPARGIIQMEPFTAQDIYKNYLKYHLNYYKVLMDILGKDEKFKVPFKWQLGNTLKDNDIYAIAMCRIFYLRQPGKIPSSMLDIAGYYKKYYNTFMGKGTVQGFFNRWRSNNCDQLMKDGGYIA